MEASNSSLQTRRLTLEQLVSHFLASKRSLTSYNQVWRANHIVASARASLEDIAVCNTRNHFARNNLHKHVLTLKALRHGTEAVSQDGRDDFKAVLRTLDAAHSRVRQTLQLLKTTTVDSSFRPAEETPKCLHDFVDEQGVEELTRTFRECIDRTNDAQNDFDQSNEAFDGELQEIESALPTTTADPASFRHVATLFRSLESHATEMADLLQSLVRHYDLCLTALKHTEGGGEAVQEAEVDLPAGVDAEMLEREAPPQPVSDQELADMIQVLDKDAAEVEDVVQEIRHRASEMESHLEQILSCLDQQQAEQQASDRVTSLLGELSKNLPNYVGASSTFLERWQEQKVIITAKLGELESAHEFYDGFLTAYNGLILEVGRRKTVEMKMEKIVQEAHAKLEQLYQDDLSEREVFKKERGEFLPSDIWPGLVDAPRRFALTEIGSAPVAFPNLAKDAIEKTLQDPSGKEGPG